MVPAEPQETPLVFLCSSLARPTIPTSRSTSGESFTRKSNPSLLPLAKSELALRRRRGADGCRGKPHFAELCARRQSHEAFECESWRRGGAKSRFWAFAPHFGGLFA